jgi:hypothetical protein
MDVAGEESDNDLVPTVFRWEHGGRNVYITGTFNNWERQVPPVPRVDSSGVRAHRYS